MAMATQSPISLTILRRGETNIIDLAEVGALIPRSETRVQDTFLRELAQEMQLLATFGQGQERSAAGQSSLAASAPSKVSQDLQRLGSVIFSHLFTEPARTRLRTAAPCALHLRLDEQLLAVPWELAYDGTDFLATKFGVGRQVITSQPVPQKERGRPGEGPVKVLLIADPTESLPQASREVEQLCRLLTDMAGLKVTLMGGKLVRKLPLLAAVQEYDIVHFAGHSFYDPASPGQSGWQLHEGVLSAAELSKVRRPPRLVFSNSCQAGTTAAWEKDTGYRYEGQAFGLGSAFLLAGVQNYVGTFWVVHDEESVGFALAFYQHLAKGMPLGGALQQARQAVIKHHDGRGLTWASYLLYGDPTAALLPAHTEQLYSGSSKRDYAREEELEQEPGVAMSRPGMRRKLAAIFSADVAGYSRLMGDDEEATIRTLAAHQGVMRTLIQQHCGRVVDAPGDNLLAEFASAVDAVRCAVDIQRELGVRNAAVPARRKMAFRIGINLGDVVTEGERLYGDGVNIAARLESLAEPGGICVSGTVYDQIENKLVLNYAYQGEHTVKNIAKPVRVYRVVMERAVAPENQHGNGGGEMARRGIWSAYRKQAVWAFAGLGLLVGGLVTLRSPSLPTLRFSQFAIGTPEALPLPDKPSLIVLPFVNMSKDPEQDYFSDGLTEDLTSDLAKISSLFVIARNSAFTYKGKAMKVQDVGREMGVRYVLEGSVRKADQRVRITVQLIEATTGHHLWSERYDRPLQEIFTLQDDVVRKIVTTLNLQLSLQEQGILVRKRTDNLDAYDYFLRGVSFYERPTTKELNERSRQVKETLVQARQMFEKAIELDPSYAEAYAHIGMTYIREWIWRLSPWNNMSSSQALERAFEFAQKAIALDDSLEAAHQVLSWVYMGRGPWMVDQAIAEGRRAIALAPNEPGCYADLASILLFEYWNKGTSISRVDEALKLLEMAMRLNPRYESWYLSILAEAYLLKGRYEEAVVTSKKNLSQDEWHLNARLQLALAYLFLDREAEAQAEAAEILRLYPNFNMQGLKHPYRDPAELVQALKAEREAWLERR
jgi:adenylate cyclase